METKKGPKPQPITPAQATTKIMTLCRRSPRTTVTLYGPPGQGKTDLVHQAADRLTAEGLKTIVIAFHLVSMSPEDLGGVLCTIKNPDGSVRADKVPLHALYKLIDPDCRIIAFGDDVGNAAPTLQAAWMQLVQSRCLNEHKISNEVMFVMATNGRSHGTAARPLIAALRDRAVEYTIETTVDSWSDWAMNNDIDERIIAFAGYYEEHLPSKQVSLHDWKPSEDDTDKQPTFRGLHRMSDMLKLGLDDYVDVRGNVGSAMAHAYMNFKALYDKMPDIDLLLKSPTTTPLPDHAGVAYAVINALLCRVRDNVKTAAPAEKYLTRLEKQTGGSYQAMPLVQTFVNRIINLPNYEEVAVAMGGLITRHAQEITNRNS